MYGLIYKITNLINQKIYVGYTTFSIHTRFLKHITSSKKGNHAINRAIRKYGKENFFIEQIDSAKSFEELVAKEIYWIDRLKSINSTIGYNMTGGGEGQLGRIQSEEEKAKRAKHYEKPIKCLETEEVFNSIADATRKLGFTHSAIWNNLNGLVIKASGLSFEYLNEPNDKKKTVSLRKKKIICLTTNEIFESTAAAAKKFNISRSNIKNVLRGRNNSTKGLEFKYFES